MLAGSVTIAISFRRPLALGTGEDLHPERAGQKLRPPAVSARALGSLGLGRRAGIRRLGGDARPPRARGREPALIVEPRRGDAGGQPAEQRQGVHVDRDRSVRVRLFQGDAEEAVGAKLDALLRDGRTQDLAQERLAARRVERAGARGRVQSEAIEASAERLDALKGEAGVVTCSVKQA